MKKIVVIGATGTVGQAVSAALKARHEVIEVGATRGQYRVDSTDPASIERLFGEIGKVDGVVTATGKFFSNGLDVMYILANAGGVIVSYFEWVQANQAYWWSREEVDERLKRRMVAAWQAVLATSESRRVSLREAATLTAVQRVAEAHRTRGLYP